MDLRKLKTLIDLVSDSNVSELEITEAEGKVRIVKGGVMVQQAPNMMVAAHASATAPPAQGQVPALPAVAEVPQGHVVKSPMVGTFYLAASPGAKPFVQVGSVVKEGETVKRGQQLGMGRKLGQPELRQPALPCAEQLPGSP